MELTILARLVLTLVVVLPVYHVACIARNYLKVRKTGLPVVILVVSPTNPAWMILNNSVYALAKRLGLGWLLRFENFGWQSREKAAPFLEKGPAIWFVSPDKNFLELADADAINQLLQAERKGIYGRPYAGMQMLDVFGPNVLTAQGTDWNRMRRLTAASFNENASLAVWSETLRQASQMLARWLAAGESGVTTTAPDTHTLALNVMLSAGFGKAYDFDASPSGHAASTKPPPADGGTGAMDYREALKLVLENAILVMGLGTDTVPRLGLLSKKLAAIGRAIATYKQYMVDVLEEAEKEGQEMHARGNLLTNLLRASAGEVQLSQPEVFGNMFVYLFAGHDTTAHSLAFTFMLLSIYPEIQDWMREEIRRVLRDDDPQSWGYEEFAKLKKTLAVQLETVRLYSPTLGVLKTATHSVPHQLTLGKAGCTITIPAGTTFNLNIHAIHNHPRYWGDDAPAWKPSRWMETDGDGEEAIVVPPKGTYLPWSDGARSCPGRKFAHVEHVALMAAAFRDHRVEPARERGESADQARRRVMDVVKATQMGLTIHMVHPERARLVWKKC